MFRTHDLTLETKYDKILHMKNMTCRICEESKPEEEFAWRKINSVRHHICKKCQRIKSKDHYLKNKDQYIRRSAVNDRIRMELIKREIYLYLQQHPCTDCGETDPIVLEFDHIRKKHLTISIMISRGFAIDKIMREIEKCEVRCANCHRRKTSKSRGFWKTIMPS